MSSIQFAWCMYFLGAIGCSLVAWWMFSWAVRFVRYSAVATTLVLLLVPFSIDKEAGTLAPALFAVVFEGMAQGAAAMERPLKLIIGLWVMVEILIAFFVFLTRKSYLEKQQAIHSLNNQQSLIENEVVENNSVDQSTELEISGNLDAIESAELFPQESLEISREHFSEESSPQQKPRARKKPSVDGKASDAKSAKEKPIRATRD